MKIKLIIQIFFHSFYKSFVVFTLNCNIHIIIPRNKTAMPYGTEGCSEACYKSKIIFFADTGKFVIQSKLNFPNLLQLFAFSCFASSFVQLMSVRISPSVVLCWRLRDWMNRYVMYFFATRCAPAS